MPQALSKTRLQLKRIPVGLPEIYEPVNGSLTSVNELLKIQINSSENLLSQRLEHSGLNSGKRIRPVLLLLSGACFAEINETHIAAAAALELVHTATLVHDDVLDGADSRRHQKSLNSRWNNTTSILTGDYLFSKAFDVCCSSGNMEVIRRVARSSCKVCEGEIKQNAKSGCLEITEAEYMEMVSQKTAELCKCSCGLGALLSNSNAQTIMAFESYGENLGVAFQIIDDVLDIVGQQDQVGKTLGTDLANRKITLPLIHCLAKLNHNQQADLLRRLTVSDLEPAELIERLKETQSINYARQTARNHAAAAFKFASSLPESRYSKSLCQLAEFVIERTY